MSALVPFAYEGHAVRVVTGDDGEPRFVLADLCRVLDLGNPSMVAQRLDDDGLSSAEVIDSLGRAQTSHVVTESGMYEVILLSRKPEARAFKRWITHDVLPTIRRTGSYGRDVAALSPRDLALLVIAEADRADRAEQKAAALAPSAAAWDTLADASGDYSLRDAAQVLDRDPAITTGQNRLGRYLREIGWLDTRGIPYQRHVDCGRIRSRARTYAHPRTGEQIVAEPQVRITPKGLGELHRLLGGTGSLDLTPPRHLEAV